LMGLLLLSLPWRVGLVEPELSSEESAPCDLCKKRSETRRWKWLKTILMTGVEL
jgi:hypothetical protein